LGSVGRQGSENNKMTFMAWLKDWLSFGRKLHDQLSMFYVKGLYGDEQAKRNMRIHSLRQLGMDLLELGEKHDS
jgi:hypothetical protein